MVINSYIMQGHKWEMILIIILLLELKNQKEDF
jgi:hypothetical protein